MTVLKDLGPLGFKTESRKKHGEDENLQEYLLYVFVLVCFVMKRKVAISVVADMRPHACFFMTRHLSKTHGKSRYVKTVRLNTSDGV